MTNLVTLHGDKRWKAVLEYQHENGPISIEHFLEEIAELHLIIEHGPRLEHAHLLHGHAEPARRWRRTEQCRKGLAKRTRIRVRDPATRIGRCRFGPMALWERIQFAREYAAGIILLSSSGCANRASSPVAIEPETACEKRYPCPSWQPVPASRLA